VAASGGGMDSMQGYIDQKRLRGFTQDNGAISEECRCDGLHPHSRLIPVGHDGDSMQL